MLRIRIDEEITRKLNAVCEAQGKSMSEIVRAGIERQYAEMKK
ncbi:ribbon-helix-helix protein, CopG family [Neglecta sp. X4]|nr:ribbon-helix-helix protein, CopG family [Neglectibacter sp. 59]NBJ74823.1 ribbon-helix-helix protein, CopG family [Neglectibacter sp. X4]NCE82573.1 ribbon-helix-helix protein, CopG family [Neglectibacter sp. X58]